MMTVEDLTILVLFGIFIFVNIAFIYLITLKMKKYYISTKAKLNVQDFEAAFTSYLKFMASTIVIGIPLIIILTFSLSFLNIFVPFPRLVMIYYGGFTWLLFVSVLILSTFNLIKSLYQKENYKRGGK
ncbi:hypothetical protein [Candidatus Pyrohabitans sp.]